MKTTGMQTMPSRTSMARSCLEKGFPWSWLTEVAVDLGAGSLHQVHGTGGRHQEEVEEVEEGDTRVEPETVGLGLR